MTTTIATRQPEASTDLHVLRLVGRNFLRLEAFCVDAKGGHVLIKGKNGSGKTSALRLFTWLLKGLSVRDIPEPIHDDADQANGEVDFGEFVIKRVRTRKGETLQVLARDGSKVKRPQEFLDALAGEGALDPVAFLQMRPRDQLDAFLSAYGVGAPVDAVEKITGEKNPVRQGESAEAYLMRLSADETGTYYVRRREANRVCEQKRGAVTEQLEVVDSLGGPIQDGEEIPSASALLGEMNELQEIADHRRRLQDDLAECQRECKKVDDALAGVEATRRQALAVAENIEQEIAELQARLAAKREEIGHLDQRIAKGKQLAAEWAEDVKAAEANLAAYADPSPRLTQIRKELAIVEQLKDRYSKRRHACEQLECVRSDLEKALADHKRLDDIVSGLRDLRAHLLDGLDDLGIAGLSVGDGELRLDGVPFRQASMAQRIRVAAAVAMRQPRRIKVLVVDDGEHLDEESWQILLSMAWEKGYQVLATMVANYKDMLIEVVDGQAS